MLTIGQLVLLYRILLNLVQFSYFGLSETFTVIFFVFVLQSNFATLDEKTGIVTSRRADRHFEEEGPILCASLDGMKLPSFPEYEVRVRCRYISFQFMPVQ